MPFWDAITASESQTGGSLHETLPFAPWLSHGVQDSLLLHAETRATRQKTGRLLDCQVHQSGRTVHTIHATPKGSGKDVDLLPMFPTVWIRRKTRALSSIMLNKPCFEIILYFHLLNNYTSIKLGGQHGSKNQVLYFLRKRSAPCCGSGLPVLRSRDLGIHVMLAQVLISLLLIAGILAVFTLALRPHG